MQNLQHKTLSGLLVGLLILLVSVPTWAQDPESMRHTLVDWLECEECVDGELEAVATLGEEIVPSLIASLEVGPAPASRELMRYHLIATYQDLVEYEQTHPEAAVTMSEQEYVDTYLANFDALYRGRSAEALGKIGGAKAKAALTGMLRKSTSLRADVRQSIEVALGGM